MVIVLLASFVLKSIPDILLAVISVLMIENALAPTNTVESVLAEEPDTSNLPRGLVEPIPTLPPAKMAALLAGDPAVEKAVRDEITRQAVAEAVKPLVEALKLYVANTAQHCGTGMTLEAAQSALRAHAARQKEGKQP